MSAVDVLAALRSLMTDAAITRMYDHDAEVKHVAAENALAAVAELIEAGREYREAVAAREADDYGARKVYERAEVAQDRFDAALARVGGAK